MMRSMYSGVAGLRVHQTRMDVIGNNIANVNTVGYKAQAALFQDLLYQNSSSASGPNDANGIGGINPKQVGLGSKLGSISTNITLPGSAETTNNPFDIMITGDSFFIVNNGRDNLFTRDGSFKLDAAGNLVMSANGYYVMGWQPDPTTGDIKPDTVSALRIMSAANMTYPPEATTEAYVSGIIDADSPEVNSDDGKVMNLNFYDSRGYKYTAKMAIKKLEEDPTSEVHSYSCELTQLLDATGNDVKDSVGAKLGNTYLEGATKPYFKKDDYKLAEAAGGGYTLTTPENADTVPTVARTVYTIQDGTVTAVTYANATDQANGNGTAVSDQDAWKGVADAFGYNDVDEFKSMAYKNPNNATANALKVEDSLATILGIAIPASGAGGTGGTVNDLMNNGLGFDGKFIDGMTIRFKKSDGSFDSVSSGTDGTANLTFDKTLPDAANFENIKIDFTTLSNVGNEKVTTASATNGSLQGKNGGRRIGKMSGISIQNDGKIYCTYDNGQSKLVGQIAVASFANAAGLQKEGDNLYSATQNSGDFDGIGIDITSDAGYMTTGELEMSNVDLSSELTGMIVTQRGFQANSRIITVSDTMLEELINLKR